MLVADAMHDRLGPNPVEALTHQSGDWALRLLLLTLAINPLLRALAMPALMDFRRLLGLKPALLPRPARSAGRR